MRNPEQQQPPHTTFVAEQVYALADKTEEYGGLRLADAFNNLPYDLDGIAVYRTDGKKEEESPDTPAIISFNGDLTAIEAAGLRESDDQKIFFSWAGRTRAVELGRDQKEQKQPVRSRAKFLGSIGIGGAGGGASYAVTEFLIDAPAASDTALALIVGGMSYIVTRPFVKRQKIREAEQSLVGLRERCLDPDQGGISFLRDKKYSFPVEPNDTSPPSEPMTAIDKLRHLPQNTAMSYGINNLNYLEDRKLTIRLGHLLELALSKAENPGLFWHEYLGEKAKALFDYETRAGQIESEIERLENIRKLTGRTDETRLSAHHHELDEHSTQMFGIVYDIIEQGEAQVERQDRKRRIANAEKLIDGIVTGEIDEAHETCEMELQALKNTVVTSLSALDLEAPGTLETARTLKMYLQEVRVLILRPDEMKIFYDGLQKQFSGQLPNLPKWEEVQGEFTKRANLQIFRPEDTV